MKQEEMIGMFTQIHSRKHDKVATRKPAYPYDPVLSVETPSLLINMKQFERNIRAMNTFIDDKQLTLRPFSNLHKCSDIIMAQFKMHNKDANRKRMNGICCSTINESELLINSASNFLSPNSDNKIRDVLLCDICIDLGKMWRFVSLSDTTVLNMRLSTFADDIFQIHLWNYTMDEFKKTNQSILSKHTSSVSDGSKHQSNESKLGIMLVLKSRNDQIGINVTSDDGIKSLAEIIGIIHGEYGHNLYLRGFYMDDTDEICRKWISESDNLKKIGVANLDNLFVSHVNEQYVGEYIFDDSALTILSTISNVYYDGNEFIHLLDCGYNSYANVPLKMARYHRPNYALNADASLSAMLNENEFEEGYKYEIVNNGKNGEYNTLLICDKELDVGGKVELVPNGYNSTVNLHNYFVVVNDEKQTVDGIWTIDARGPGN